MVSSENIGDISGPVRLERPATGGAVGRLDDGRVVFVRHGLPGELVRVDITETTAKFSRGDAVEVLEPSPERVAPPCRYAHPGGCGGCDLQHASGDAQLSWKSTLVAEHLRRIAGVEPAFSIAVPVSDAQASRTRLRRRLDPAQVPTHAQTRSERRLLRR